MNGFQSSPQDGPAGSTCSIEGLPPLPKGLSGILNSSGGSWRDIEKVYSKKTRIQDDLSKSRHSSNLDKLLRGTKNETPCLKHVVIRRQVGLRQLDMSLIA
ncbi:leucine repeat adapter protein 25-like [Huso huso]|uniref:Leucine repeat adapter protein 25-like n=1 Tax=Huso huso TaxID=61971 RepID=A0ABR0Y0X1_HUSHU